MKNHYAKNKRLKRLLCITKTENENRYLTRI